MVTYENHGLKDYFNLYPDFNKSTGEPIYAFSAIFSPKGLNTTIIHEWQYYDENQKKWITDRKINLPVVGGRDGGFRTYSKRPNLGAGRWRVNIKTTEGQTIGHLRFNLVPIVVNPWLKTTVR